MSDKEARRLKRHGKIRKRISGTPERPRLCVHRSLKNLYVQVVDDTAEKTIIGSSTLSKEVAGKGKVTSAAKLGEFFAKRLKEKGITRISFDRGGYKYHGRVKALADSLRAGGIEF